MYTQIASNKRKSILFVLGFVVLIGGLDYIFARAFGQPSFFIPILIVAVAYAFISYFYSAHIALALSGAVALEKKDNPGLYNTVENLAIATGRDPEHAVVCVTTGILPLLEKSELEGVIAHELSHVGNFDIRFMAVVVGLVSVVGVLSDLFLRISFWSRDDREEGNQLFLILGIIGAILAPLVAALIQFAVSRQREYLADSSGALLTRYPEGLARALEKISANPQPLQHASSTTSPLYIINPLKGRSLASLFDTHPPIKDRIARLRQMETSQ